MFNLVLLTYLDPISVQHSSRFQFVLFFYFVLTFPHQIFTGSTFLSVLLCSSFREGSVCLSLDVGWMHLKNVTVLNWECWLTAYRQIKPVRNTKQERWTSKQIPVTFGLFWLLLEIHLLFFTKRSVTRSAAAEMCHKGGLIMFCHRLCWHKLWEMFLLLPLDDKTSLTPSILQAERK